MFGVRYSGYAHLTAVWLWEISLSLCFLNPKLKILLLFSKDALRYDRHSPHNRPSTVPGRIKKVLTCHFKKFRLSGNGEPMGTERVI